MINKDRSFFQYKNGDLVYIISPLTSQLTTSSRKVAIKYIGHLVAYKIMDPNNSLLMMLGGKILRGLFCATAQSISQHVDAGQLNVPP